MQGVQAIIDHPITLLVIGALVGAFLNYVFLKFQNKTSVLGFTRSVVRVAVSAEDALFGSIRVMLGEQQVRNLFLCTIEVENMSSTDQENVKFKVYTGNDTCLYNVSAVVMDTPYAIPLTDEFTEFLKIPEGQQVSQVQLDRVRHERDYQVVALNRDQKLKFTCLCQKLNDDNDPYVTISTPNKGIRLKEQKQPFEVLNPIFGVPVARARVRAVLLAVPVIFICGLLIDNIWISLSVVLLYGLLALACGSIFYKIERAIRSFVAG
ncbi:hypothetical protein [Kordiimonas sp.]|uniref:hypothetical protein n=1 Tax=Kordiimonas sp. TaxID=1970157 RepID=UPI003A8DE63A